VSEHVTLYWT